jgi:hypothetical protein
MAMNLIGEHGFALPFQDLEPTEEGYTMNRLTGLIVAGLFGAAVQPAVAQDWNGSVVCGGNAFAVCASVHVSISAGNVVTMDVWNLSGLEGTYANTLFTKIGFYGAGTAGVTASNLTMTGGTTGNVAPATWQLESPNNAGGIQLNLTTSANGTSSSINNSIASGCATNLPNGVKMGFWQSYGCNSSLPALEGGFTELGAVRLTFEITGTWDLSQTDMLIMGQNGPDGLSTQCITGENCYVVPEPLTIALLGSGLVSMGGLGMVRRRKQA